VNICQMNSSQIPSALGYWWSIFDLVAMLKIFFIPAIEFSYSTGGPLLTMSSPMSWQRPFVGCCPVAREPSEHWIAIWPAKFALNIVILNQELLIKNTYFGTKSLNMMAGWPNWSWPTTVSFIIRCQIGLIITEMHIECYCIR
jgi:hypothetical protein